ncbi:MAG: STAS domain-containing protein [Steroidobacteraceae bacterium]
MTVGCDSNGAILLSGALGFATARNLHEELHAALVAASPGPITVDLAGVDHADSAGLAVLVDALGWAKRNARAMRLQNLPQSLRSIARICEVEQLLDGGVHA